MTVTNIYFPGDAPIEIHQNRVSHCPKEFPAGYFWYGGKRKGAGRPPRWVETLLGDQNTSCPEPREEANTCDPEKETEPMGLVEVSEALDIPVEDTEVGESESDEALGSEEEAVEPPDPPVKMPRTRGTQYSL